MKKMLVLFLIIFTIAGVYAQENSDSIVQAAPQKHALIIGNGDYSGGLSKLNNPVNDANDISAVLEHLGFDVEKILNGDLSQMENAVIRLRDKLKNSNESYGFFYYAGHGVQSNGENYLIPVNSNIPTENYLKARAISLQVILDDLNDAGNALNVVILDACRDNPFSWSRSGSRGLSVVSSQPADSIVMYATSAGQRASDGEGRNGFFTKELMNNLVTPGLDVNEVFRRTGAEVARASNNQQVPAIYSQFFGIAYLGDKPVEFEGFYIPASTTVVIGGEAKEPQPEKFWSIGASIGSCFIEPWLVGTIRGTIAPFSYSFFEVGLDAGFVSGKPDLSYYSFTPFAHAAFFWPLRANKIGLYAGAGGGYMWANYKFSPQGELRENTFAIDAVAGINLFDMLDISYTFRTDFTNASNKVSAGYTYRFK